MTLEEREKVIQDRLNKITNGSQKIKVIIKKIKSLKPGLLKLKNGSMAKVASQDTSKLAKLLEKSEVRVTKLESNIVKNERKHRELEDKKSKKEQELIAFRTESSKITPEYSIDYYEKEEQHLVHEYRLKTELNELEMEMIRLEERNANYELELYNIDEEYPQFFEVNLRDERLRQIAVDQEQFYHMPADAKIKVKMFVTQNKIAGRAFRLIKEKMSSSKGKQALYDLTAEELMARIPNDEAMRKHIEIMKVDRNRVPQYEELHGDTDVSLAYYEGRKYLDGLSFESSMELNKQARKKIEYSHFAELKESFEKAAMSGKLENAKKDEWLMKLGDSKLKIRKSHLQKDMELFHNAFVAYEAQQEKLERANQNDLNVIGNQGGNTIMADKTGNVAVIDKDGQVTYRPASSKGGEDQSREVHEVPFTKKQLLEYLAEQRKAEIDLDNRVVGILERPEIDSAMNMTDSATAEENLISAYIAGDVTKEELELLMETNVIDKSVMTNKLEELKQTNALDKDFIRENSAVVQPKGLEKEKVAEEDFDKQYENLKEKNENEYIWKHVREEGSPQAIEHDAAEELYKELLKNYSDRPDILQSELFYLESMYPGAKAFPDFEKFKNQAEEALLETLTEIQQQKDGTGKRM